MLKNGIKSDIIIKINDFPLITYQKEIPLMQSIQEFEKKIKRVLVTKEEIDAAIKEAGLRLDLEAPTAEAPSMTMALEQYLAKTNK
jgi:hypothetical protein